MTCVCVCVCTCVHHVCMCVRREGEVCEMQTLIDANRSRVVQVSKGQGKP